MLYGIARSLTETNQLETLIFSTVCYDTKLFPVLYAEMDAQATVTVVKDDWLPR